MDANRLCASEQEQRGRAPPASGSIPPAVDDRIAPVEPEEPSSGEMQHKLTSLGRKGHKTVLFVGQGPVKSELKQRCICLRKLSLIVTALAALMAGAALFAIAARGIWASVSHALTGNAGNALLVGLIAVACFLAALAFLVPGWFRRIIRTGEQRRYRMPVTFGASVVLLVIAFGAAVTDRASGDQISGLVPHKALLPATLAFAALFCLAFIVPGLAYRMNPDGKASLPDASRAPRPARSPTSSARTAPPSPEPTKRSRRRRGRPPSHTLRRPGDRAGLSWSRACQTGRRPRRSAPEP